MYSKLNIGDMLHRSKGIAQHTGVYLGNGQVLHNQPGQGIVITSYAEYAEDITVKVVKTTNTNHQLLAKRLREIVGTDERYHLLANNCEHVASFLINGKRFSPQIQATAVGAVIGGLISGQFKSGNWLFWAAFGGLTALWLTNLVKKYDYNIQPMPIHYNQDY